MGAGVCDFVVQTLELFTETSPDFLFTKLNLSKDSALEPSLLWCLILFTS